MKTKNVVLVAAGAWLLFFGGWGKVKAMFASNNATASNGSDITMSDIEQAANEASSDLTQIVAASTDGSQLAEQGIDPTTGKPYLAMPENPLSDVDYTRCEMPLTGVSI